MSVLPSSVSEYSTATIFDLVSRLPTNPVDSSSRRVRVSMRWEMPRRRCRSSPWRWGLPSSENRTLGVHLPIYTDPTAADSRAVMPLHLLVACLVERSRPPRVLRPHGGENSSVPITGWLESLQLASATLGGARGASGGEQSCSWLRRRRRDWQAEGGLAPRTATPMNSRGHVGLQKDRGSGLTGTVANLTGGEIVD